MLRLSQQRQSQFRLAHLHQQGRKLMQRLWMRWIPHKDSPVQGLSFGKLPGLLVLHGKPEVLLLVGGNLAGIRENHGHRIRVIGGESAQL